MLWRGPKFAKRLSWGLLELVQRPALTEDWLSRGSQKCCVTRSRFWKEGVRNVNYQCRPSTAARVCECRMGWTRSVQVNVVRLRPRKRSVVCGFERDIVVLLERLVGPSGCKFGFSGLFGVLWQKPVCTEGISNGILETFQKQAFIEDWPQQSAAVPAEVSQDAKPFHRDCSKKT